MSVVGDVVWVLEKMIVRLEELKESDKDKGRSSKKCVAYVTLIPLPVNSLHEQAANFLNSCRTVNHNNSITIREQLLKNHLIIS